MALTTRWSLRKPAITDSPNGPLQIGQLADDVDAALPRRIEAIRATHLAVSRNTSEYTALGVFNNVPDPGVPYKLRLSYFAPSIAANGCQLRVSVVMGFTTTADASLAPFFVLNNYSNGVGLDMYESRTSDTRTGVTRVGAYAQRISAAGDWLLQPGYLDIEVITAW